MEPLKMFENLSVDPSYTVKSVRSVGVQIGVALGSVSEPTGICVVEREARTIKRAPPSAAELVRMFMAEETKPTARFPDISELRADRRRERTSWPDRDEDEVEYWLLVRHIESLAPNTKWREVAGRLDQLLYGIKKLERNYPAIYLDVTGKGDSALDFFRGLLRATMFPVYFNHGDQQHDEKGKLFRGKAALVARLRAFFESGRLQMTKTRDTETLVSELLAYQVDLAPDANDRQGAFKVGSRDELVTALGLALDRWNPMSDW